MIYIKRYITALLMVAALIATPFTLQGDILGDIPSTQDIPILTGGVVPTAQLGSGSATSSTFLRGDSTWQTPATISDGDKTDITVSVTGTVWTIDNNVVTYVKMQDISAASKLLGRGDSGSGDTQEITLGSGLLMTGTTVSATAVPIDPLVLVNSSTPLAAVNQITAWAADTDSVAGKSGLHVITEDGTSHVLGDKVGIGLITGLNSKLHVRDANAVQTTITVDTYTDSTSASAITLRHARGTNATPTLLSNGDTLGSIQMYGYGRNAADTADEWTRIARIRGQVDSKDAQGRLGGQIDFYVSPGVGAADTEVMTLDQTGLLTLNTGGVSALSTLLRGSTSGTLTHLPNATTTNHTLTWPAAQGAASTVLTNNGSGTLTWAASGSGLSGGAADKLAIWTGAAALTNDTNLHWDSTKNSLGLGTATFGTGLNNGIGLFHDSATYPSTNVTDTVQLYANDQAGTATTALTVRSEGGVVSSLGRNLILNATAALGGAGAIGPGSAMFEGGNDSAPRISFSNATGVAHGMTSIVPTSVWFDARPYYFDYGGVQIRGFTEDLLGMILSSLTSTNPDTTKLAASTSAMQLDFGKKSGTTLGAMAAGVNLLAIANNYGGSGNVWLVDTDGDSWQPGTAIYKRNIEANTAGSGSPNILVGSTENLKILTNEGASAKNYHTLPPAVEGWNLTFYIQDADGLRITAAAGDTVRIGTLVSAAAGYCESTTIGDYVTVVSINATEWVSIGHSGTWVCA